MRKSLASAKAGMSVPKIEVIQRASAPCRIGLTKNSEDLALAFEIACEDRRLEVLSSDVIRLAAEAEAQTNPEDEDGEELCTGQECLRSEDSQSTH